MAVGKQAGMAGGSVPLNGESEIRQNSSATDVLTITMASGANSTTAGKALVVRKWVDPLDGGKSTTAGVFSIDALGNPAFAAGSSLSLGASGSLAIPVWPVVTVTSGAGGVSTLGYTVLAANAGKLHVLNGSSAAGGKVVMPAASGVAIGTQFFFLMNGAANSSAVKITSSLSSSDDFMIYNAINSTGKSIEPKGGSTAGQIGAAVGIVKISAKRWWAYQMGPGTTAASVWNATGAVA